MAPWGFIAGTVTTAACLLLAPLDGGLSAFASWSAFQASFGAGTIVLAEAKASYAAGRAVGKLVDATVKHDQKKKKKARSEVADEAKDAFEEQVNEGNVEALVSAAAEHAQNAGAEPVASALSAITQMAFF